MRTVLVSLVLLVFAATAFADGGCGPCPSKAGCGKKCGPDWAYTFQDAHWAPSHAPKPLYAFHDALIPVIEARRSSECAYIRENAGGLYKHAKAVVKHRCDDYRDKCCGMDCGPKGCCKDKKMAKRAAKELVRSCDRLRELCYGGSDAAVYQQVKVVEEGYVRLANLYE